MILSLDGDYGIVKSVVVIEDANQPMYNLTVDEAHTFFVGDGEWLVHNTCKYYAPYFANDLNGGSGIAQPIQDALAVSIRQSNPDMMITVRSRAHYSEIWDASPGRAALFANKPMGARVDKWAKSVCGLRWCTVPGGQNSWYVSDIDVGFAVINGKNVADSDFILMSAYGRNGIPLPGARPVSGTLLPGNLVNTTYGIDVIVNGYLDGIIDIRSGVPAP